MQTFGKLVGEDFRAARLELRHGMGHCRIRFRLRLQPRAFEVRARFGDARALIQYLTL